MKIDSSLEINGKFPHIEQKELSGLICCKIAHKNYRRCISVVPENPFFLDRDLQINWTISSRL